MESGIPQKPRGTLIGKRYEVVGYVGTGRLGAVYVARDLSQNQLIALRTFPATLCDPVFAQRLSLSFQAMRTLANPHLARMLDAGMQNGECFCTMEHLRGSPLSEYFAHYDPRNPFPWQVVSDVFGQICAGLQAIHKANLIHGNLSAANVFIEEGDVVKLIDYGIVPAARVPSSHGGMASQQNDLQALGIIFYQLLSGQPPAPAGAPAVPLRTDMPEWAEELLWQLLAPKSDMRPRNIEDVLRAHQVSVEPPESAQQPKRSLSIEFGEDLSASLAERLRELGEEADHFDDRLIESNVQRERASHQEKAAAPPSPPPSPPKEEQFELAPTRKYRSESMRIMMKAFGKKVEEKDAEEMHAGTARSKSLRMMLKKERMTQQSEALQFENDTRQRSVSLRMFVPNKVMPKRKDYARVGVISCALLVVCGILAYPRLSYLFSAPRAPVSAPGYRADQGELAAIEHYVANFRRDFRAEEKLPFHYKNLQAELGILLPADVRDFRQQQFSSDGTVFTMSTLAAPAEKGKP